MHALLIWFREISVKDRSMLRGQCLKTNKQIKAGDPGNMYSFLTLAFLMIHYSMFS